jgi:hypothetical protein
LRDDLSLASFRHGGFTESADADLTDAQLRAAGRHRSTRQLPTYAKRTREQLIELIDVAEKRVQSERLQRFCHNEQLTGCQNGENTTG